MDTTEHQELVNAFDVALKKADIYIRWAKLESLRPVAVRCYQAFQEARNALSHDEEIPYVPGNDPHDCTKLNERTSNLRVAMSGVFGFTVGGAYAEKSPHTIAALRAMQPIATLLHSRDLAIFT